MAKKLGSVLACGGGRVEEGMDLFAPVYSIFDVRCAGR